MSDVVTTPSSVNVIKLEKKTVTVVRAGVQGPPGPQGLIGPVGSEVTVLNFPDVQPVSGTVTVPLPTGAATDANISTRLGLLGQKTKISSAPVVIASDQGPLEIEGTVSANVAGTVTVNNFPPTQAVSLASAPLPTGAATDATLTSGAQKTQLTDGLNPIGTSARPLRTDPTGTTVQPVSGSVTVTNLPGTQPVSVAALPLPSGAATDATLTAGVAKTQIYDGANTIGVASHPIRTDPTGNTAQPVTGSVSVNNLPSLQPVSGTVTANIGASNGLALDATLTSGAAKTQISDGTNVLGTSAHPVKTDPTGTTVQPVSGTVTANVGTTNGLALDATLTGGAVKAQISDGTNVIGTAAHPVKTDPTGTTTQPVSGTVTANVGSTNGLALDATLTGGTAKAQIYDGVNVLGTAAHPVKTDPTGTTTQPVSGSVAVTNLPATQPVSGTVTANVGTTNGLALDATLTGGTAKVQIYDGSSVIGTSAHPVKTDPTGTTTQPVSGTITVQQTTPANLQAEVGGLGANGSAVSGNPVLVGGSDGTNTRTLLTDTSGRKIMVGAAAAGAAAAGNPVLIGSQDPSGNAQALTSAADKSILVSQSNNQQSIKVNATITGSGSTIVTNIGAKELNLIINIKNTPTGTTPTITFTLSELDPGDQTTLIGTSVSGTAITAAITQTIKLADTTTGCVKISWTVTGSSPSFTGVYVTLSCKATEDVQEQLAPVAEDNTNGVIAVTLKPLAVTTYTWTSSFSTALAASFVAKVAAGVLRLARIRLDSTLGTGTYYIQFFNTTSAPADGTGTSSMVLAPIKVQFTTGTDQTILLDLTDAGVGFSPGLTIVLSTTEFTKTISATSALSCNILLK